MYTNHDKFNMHDFLTPSRDFSPVYAWVWNSVCTQDVIDEELAEMVRLGIRAVYIIPEPKEFRPDSMPTDLASEYLSPEYLELYAYAMRRAGELGMLCWLYDEGGWPSGGACGSFPQAKKEAMPGYQTKHRRLYSADPV